MVAKQTSKADKVKEKRGDAEQYKKYTMFWISFNAHLVFWIFDVQLNLTYTYIQHL